MKDVDITKLEVVTNMLLSSGIRTFTSDRKEPLLRNSYYEITFSKNRYKAKLTDVGTETMQLRDYLTMVSPKYITELLDKYRKYKCAVACIQEMLESSSSEAKATMASISSKTMAEGCSKIYEDLTNIHKDCKDVNDTLFKIKATILSL